MAILEAIGGFVGRAFLVQELAELESVFDYDSGKLEGVESVSTSWLDDLGVPDDKIKEASRYLEVKAGLITKQIDRDMREIFNVREKMSWRVKFLVWEVLGLTGAGVAYNIIRVMAR